MDLDFDLDSALLDPEHILEGEQVDYLPPRFAIARRKNKETNLGPNGLRRGDLVVLQDPEGASTKQREVKRIVGFPEETITIQHGDLWFDGHRQFRSYSDVLGQAILLDHVSELPVGTKRVATNFGSQWHLDNAVVKEQSNSSRVLLVGSESDLETKETPNANAQDAGRQLEFRPTRYPWIANTIAHNAHDSHEVVFVDDIGCAIQPANDFDDWQLSILLRTPSRRTEFLLDCSNSMLSVSIDGLESDADISMRDTSRWIVAMIVDGQAIVGSSDREILRLPLARNDESEVVADQDSSPVLIECRFGRLQVEQRLVFRDIHYRGSLDAPTQTISAGEGVVVLGDNVSISSDSRQRWENGLTIDSIKGVVLNQPEGFEALLRQR